MCQFEKKKKEKRERDSGREGVWREGVGRDGGSNDGSKARQASDNAFHSSPNQHLIKITLL